MLQACLLMRLPPVASIHRRPLFCHRQRHHACQSLLLTRSSNEDDGKLALLAEADVEAMVTDFVVLRRCVGKQRCFHAESELSLWLRNFSSHTKGNNAQHQTPTMKKKSPLRFSALTQRCTGVSVFLHAQMFLFAFMRGVRVLLLLPPGIALDQGMQTTIHALLWEWMVSGQLG
jgi:hypothetical protein